MPTAAFCPKCGKTFTNASMLPAHLPAPSTPQGASGTALPKPQRESNKKTKVCKTCGRKIPFWTTSLAASRAGLCNKCWRQRRQQHRKDSGTVASRNTKIITETRCTCNECGKVWHYGKQEIAERRSAQMSNAGKGMMCCTGCLPAVFIPDKKVADLDKCPNCGSKFIKKEQIEHAVTK